MDEQVEKIFINKEQLQNLGIEFNPRYLIKLERDGAFPRRIFIGERKPVWDLAEIKAWAEGKKSARN
jgi:predicted DNA-binding transcriptional regulator AlpA